MSNLRDLKVNQRKFKKNIRRAKRILENELPKKALEEAKRNTPIDRGNARRKTKLKKEKAGRGFELISDYDYSKVIDDGKYGKPPGTANGPKTRSGYSTQAPEGIYKPTLKFIQTFLRRKFRRY